MIWRSTQREHAWEIYINGKCVRKVYSKSKAINLAETWCGQLFEQRKTEVVDTMTGKVIYQIN